MKRIVIAERFRTLKQLRRKAHERRRLRLVSPGRQAARDEAGSIPAINPLDENKRISKRKKMRRPLTLASLVVAAAAALSACTPEKPAATPNTPVTPATPITAPSVNPTASPASSPVNGKIDDKKVDDKKTDDKGKANTTPEVKKTEGNSNK